MSFNLMIMVNGITQYTASIDMGGSYSARRTTKAAFDLCHGGTNGTVTPNVRVMVKTNRGWQPRVIVKRGRRYFTRVGDYSSP